MQRSALCRSRRELSNDYSLAKFGFDTAENEPCKVCPLSAYRSPRLSEEDLQKVSHLHEVQARHFVEIADELRRYRKKTGHYIWYIFPIGAPGMSDFQRVSVPHSQSSKDPNVREAVPDPPGSTVWLEALFGAEGGVGNVEGCVNGDIKDQSDPVPTWRGLLEWIAKQQEERVKVEGDSDQLTPPTGAVLPSIDHGRIWYWLALFGPAAEAAAAESSAGEATWGWLRDVCRTLAKYDWIRENGPVPGIGEGRIEKTSTRDVEDSRRFIPMADEQNDVRPSASPVATREMPSFSL